jgi:hypothetical protein
MATVTGFEMGSQVHCSDGACGSLLRLVVDPVARALTHLVVEPTHRVGMARLVPIAKSESVGRHIELSCTLAEFDRFDAAEQMQFLPGNGDEWGLDDGQVLSWPYYGLETGDVGMPTGFGGNITPPIVHDRVPVGDVEVCHGDPVQATDGWIGRVQGLVIDPRDHHVTHVLLQEGHLWGRREVAIPIAAVVSVDEGIALTLNKGEVQHLPPVDLDSGSVPPPRAGGSSRP